MSASDGTARPTSRVGKYEVIAKLGKGGMAQVHLAVVRGLGGFNKLVVLKRLDSTDEDFRRMFLDEARLAALLHHTNVVHTYEVSETDGSYFIAMEYLDGQPLDKLIRETSKLGERMEPRLCARIVADALAGLHYTHELCDYDGRPLNVVHRDVSPHNLFLTYDGTVKLLDFGVAKTAAKTAETGVGVLKGKLAYMAPEQAAGQPVDQRADVFAMGVVLWELLTLERLRQADSAAGIINEAMRGQLPDLSKVRPDVSRELEAVLWRALAHYPRRRFHSALAMRDALLAYLSHDPCEPEDLALFMQARFGDLRRQLQEQVTECLRRAEARDAVIHVGSSESSPSPAVGGHEGSLPILESGSLPARPSDTPPPEDLTTPLAPEAMFRSSYPPGPKDPGTGRSRAITFAEADPDSPSTPRRLMALGVVAAALSALVFWPSRSSSEATLPTRGAPSTAKQAPKLLLRLHGSNTIGQELAPRLAAAFLEDRGFGGVARKGSPESSVVIGNDPRDGAPREIRIEARGSTTAFVDLGNGDCDIGLSSRRIKPEEAAALKSRGLGDVETAAGEHVLGLDGIAVIVHPNSPWQRLDLSTLRRVFSGEVSDYAALGGAAGPIHLYARDERSGTSDTFKHLVVGDAPIATSARRFADSGELSTAVASDPQGIGFIGIPYVRGARALAIGEEGATALYPSAFTVATEGYELSRRLYLYVPVNDVKPLALELIAFALSGKGQAIVKDSGFVDLTLHAMPGSPCERCPARYAALTRDAQRLSLDFRFRTGSAELDSRGQRDLERLLVFMRENERGRLVLVGFSDTRGSAPQNTKLSLERAKKIADELQGRGVMAAEVLAMGQELPVASNDSDAGREKNRRVEVWLR